MKRFAVNGLFAALMTMPVGAAEVEFRGAFCVTSATSECTVPGWVAGCHVNFRFSPRSLGDNGSQTRMSIFDGFLAQNYTMASGSPNGTTYKNVAGIRFGRGVASFSAQWRITSQAPGPAALTATSSAVTFAGDITTFDNIPGCNIKFKGSGINGAIP